jgi:glycosyltransferase involved in cell wall biosynthesis
VNIEVTVAVVTRNRRNELERALSSVLSQSVGCELIVVDDGSTDGTSELVRAEFPTARLFSYTDRQGPAARRTFATGQARAELVVFLDDDAWFQSPATLAEIVENFAEAGPEIGAVALPAVDDEVELESERGVVRVTGLFRGTAVAFRRIAFLEAGGYRGVLCAHGEERDLALRLLERGHFVRAGWLSVPIGHRPSSLARDPRERDLLGRRNDLLIGWLVVPRQSLPGYLARMLGHTIVLAVRTRRASSMARGIVEGIRACMRHRQLRDPVSRSTYSLSRLLTGKALPLPATHMTSPR